MSGAHAAARRRVRLPALPRWPRRPRFRLTLRARLAAAASAAAAVMAVATAAAAYVAVDHQLNRQLDLTLTREASHLIPAIRGGDNPAAGQCTYLAAPACAQVVDAAHARPGTRGAGGLPVTAATLRTARGDRPAYFSNVSASSYPLRMLTQAVGHGHAVQVAVRRDVTERGVDRVGAVLVGAGAAGTVLAGLLGYLVSRTGLRPVGRLTRAVERIAATRDAAVRIAPEPGFPERDELARLASGFNVMLGELEASVAARKQLVADASHELRTPLTSLRTNIDVLSMDTGPDPRRRERAVAALRGQLREVTELVNDLIELARGEEPEELVEQVRLDAVVEHCVAAARGHWPDVRFSLEAAGPVLLAGVPARLARLVTNLLDNAAKFSPRPGGAVEVRLTGRELTVRDHGPGFAPEDLPHVFDRFYRARTARALPGSGLGLATAHQVARAHGADLTAEQAPGGGALLRLRLRLPGERADATAPP